MKCSTFTQKITLFITVFTLFAMTLTAQGWRPLEMEIKVSLNSREDAKLLGDLRLNGDIYREYALMYVTPAELKKIEQTGLRFEVTKDNLNDYYKDFWETREAYHNYQEIIALMDSLVAALPDLVKKTVYGQSVQGRELSALTITQNVNQYNSRPKVAFDGNIHGDEIGGGENMIRFARWLCQQYSINPEIINLLNTREVWIFPLVNPDGRVNMNRYNANGIDLNRDAGYLWDGEGSSPGVYSQPESKALRQMFYENEFNIHVTYHSGIELFLYPWYFRTDQCPDYNQVTTLANVYVTNSGYTNLESGPGTSLYPTTGSTAESFYGVMGSHGIVMELSSNKQPPPSQLMYYFNINLPSMVKMIEYSGYGVGGTITDAITGEPVRATVYIGNTLPCYSNKTGGDFHKFMVAGTYNIKVKANGYQTKLINNISVTNLSYTNVNIELEPEQHHSIFRVCATRIPGGNMADPGKSWEVIGPPDGLYYSLGKNGWMVFDMQELVVDGEGDDIIVFEGDGSPEVFVLYAGATMDGPWVFVGEGNGTSSFDFSGTALTEARYFKIVDDGDGSATVNGAGFDLDAIQALSSINGPYILLTEYMINDPTGNNNGQLDPGETADIDIVLKNIGTEDALNVMGSLSTADPNITILTTNPQSFGNLMINQSGSATFSMTADEDIPAGHVTTLALNYSGDNGVSGIKYIELTFPDYCYPNANCSFGDGFTGFSLLTISNMNNGCSPNGYGDFTNLSTTLEPGQSYTVSWQTGYNDQEACLWIDLNSDKEFDADELLINDFNMASSGTIYTTNFTVPESVMPGEKRLRIRANWQNSAANPCSNFTYGETEDYTVIIEGEILIANFTADITEFCLEGEVHFSDNSTGTVTAWNWEFPGGEPSTSSEANPVIFYDTPGSYDVTLTVTGEQTNHTVVKPGFISVHSLPVVVFAEIPDQCLNYPPFELTGGSPAGGSYSGPGVVEGWFSPEIAGLGLHMLTYTYTDQNGCENSAEQNVLVDECTGIEEYGRNFSIFPNPGKGDFFVIPDFTIQNSVIKIFNNSGETVFCMTEVNLVSNEAFRLDLKHVPSGVYLLQIGNDTRTQKLIIK
ncbi:MAG: T9SS type A sorting domain-containing protein [Bacteroidales bacterium]|nr:T9SS type A sorting domain-containing protein [Bacteroidales bacterium]